LLCRSGTGRFGVVRLGSLARASFHEGIHTQPSAAEFLWPKGKSEVLNIKRGKKGVVMNRRGEGWVLFAAIVLITAGVMRVFDAIWAFRYHGALPENLEDAIFGHSLKTYGWIYLLVAAVLIASGFLVLSGSQLARWLGVAAAALGSISAIWWMPYYPVWSLTYIGIGGLVVYALVAYGGRGEAA
jgi:hypothetical protein